MTAWRGNALARLTKGQFDLLVIGGGIVGAGIANEATRAGLRVALVDRGDFGAATSSASSKLIHGGLRYLRMGDIRLVREAHQERRALLSVVAPHLVRRMPFLLPIYRGGPYRPTSVRVGLWTYSTLAGDRLGGLADRDRALGAVPALRVEGLRGCGIYRDAWTHDGRLCLANVTAAERAGAVVLNHAELTELHRAGGRVNGAELRDAIDGTTFTVRARSVVNAAGPWVDRVRGLEDPSARPAGRLSKGVHVVLPLDRPRSAALTIPHDKVRVTFAYPWEGLLLLGTTDTEYEGDPSAVSATEADVDQVLAEAGVAVDAPLLRRERVLSAFAGLRVLPQADTTTADSRRETVFLQGKGGMLTVAGGKLTTYRRIALGALGRLSSELGLNGLDRRPVPLPGAGDAVSIAGRLLRQEGVEPAVASNLAHLYGTEAEDVVALAVERPELLSRLHLDGPDIEAQVVYARRREWATTAADVVHGRTMLEVRGLATPSVVARVDELLREA
jgi:glycerol-3-phosphate dehydrogenase